MRKRLLLVLAAVAGGVLTDLAFLPGQWWWPAAFAGMGLGYAVWRVGSARWALLTGFCWGAGFFLTLLWWSKVATAVVPWLALSLAEAAFVAVFVAGWVWVRRWVSNPLLRAATFAMVFTAGEQARSMTPFGGFPWGRLAFSQVDGPLGRLSWFGGEVLVSFMVAFVAALAVEIIAGIRCQPHKAVRACAGGLTCLALVLGPAGVQLSTAAQAGTLRVGAVQGNVNEPGLGSFANAGEVLGNHEKGTYDLLKKAPRGSLDVVLWPENGSDLDPQTNPDVAASIDRAAQAVGAPILVGAQEFPKTGGRYNVLLLWEPGVGVIDRYAKQHPAPFGEYIPMRSFVRLFSKQVDRVNIDMIPGKGQDVMELPVQRLGHDVPMGTVICFEVAYESLIDQAIDGGAQILVVPTNNASFGYTHESTQQLAMSRLRAMETGRATVQVSTVGVSAIIQPDGSVTQESKLFTADQFVANLPLRTEITPASRAGQIPGLVVLCGGIVLVLAAGARGYRRRRSRRRSSHATQDTSSGTTKGGSPELG